MFPFFTENKKCECSCKDALFGAIIGILVLIIILLIIYVVWLHKKGKIQFFLVGFYFVLVSVSPSSLTIRLRARIFYSNNRVFLSRNYRLIVAPQKFDVRKTNICPRAVASRAYMLVLRTSNCQLSGR